MKEKIWKEVLSTLEKEVSRPIFATWLKPTKIADDQTNEIIISVTNPYAKDWLEKNILDKTLIILKKYYPNVESVSVVISKPEQKTLDDLPLWETDSHGVQEEPENKPNYDKKDNPFNPKYTFDTFVVGNNNRLAFAAAQSVAEKPGKGYNPLFIYGGVGLGKTHIMQAIGNSIYQQNPNKNIAYISCETFTSEFINALQTKTINEFKKKYRSIDVFLVDDIQFLSNKEGTQEEFFHTFNSLHQTDRQIVMTSDRVPKEIPQLEDRLKTRFGWGMIADIQAPNFETRMAILQEKAKEKQLNIPDDVIEHIAQTITSNVRELEGSLIKLAAASELERQPITLEFAIRALKDLLGQGDEIKASPKKIITSVCEYFNIEAPDILGTKRIKELVYPRQLVMLIMRDYLKMSYPQIGDQLGGKDHTTIMHGVNKIETLLKTNQQVETDLRSIKKLLH